MSDGASAAAERAEDRAARDACVALLAAAGASFSLLAHAPTRTSAESAAVRGAPLASGAKAMLLKAGRALPHGSPFVLAVLSAARRADLRALRAALGAKALSLAGADDLWRLTRCAPGAVPPFASVFEGVQARAGEAAPQRVRTVCDASIADGGLGAINFNIGLRGESCVGLSVAAYLAIEEPLVLSFSEPLDEAPAEAPVQAPAEA